MTVICRNILRAMPYVVNYSVVIDVNSAASVVVVPRREVVPVPRRVPAYIRWTHPPVVQSESVSVVWSEVVVRPVDVWVTDDRNGSASVVVSDVFNEKCSHILVNILAEDSLYQHIVLTSFDEFDHSKVINISIVVKVKVAEWVTRVVQRLLKLLKISSLTESTCNHLKVKVIRNFVSLCGYRDSLCSLSRCQAETHQRNN